MDKITTHVVNDLQHKFEKQEQHILSKIEKMEEDLVIENRKLIQNILKLQSQVNDTGNSTNINIEIDKVIHTNVTRKMSENLLRFPQTSIINSNNKNDITLPQEKYQRICSISLKHQLLIVIIKMILHFHT